MQLLKRKDYRSMKQAVIIGAGPAGLTAAYQLLKETDITPVILEKSPYVGGISRTANYKGNRMDLGGHRFFSKNEEVTRIWAELMPPQGAPAKDDKITGRNVPLKKGGPDPEKTDDVSLIRNRVSRIFYLRNFFDYPITIKPATFINMGLKRTVAAGIGYLYSCVVKRRERSLEDFYINRFGKPLYSMFFEDYTEKVWGIHPSRIAPDWGAQRVKELSLGKVIADFFKKLFNPNYRTKDTSLIEQFTYPKYGPGQLWEKMADEIIRMGGQIYFNACVTAIDADEMHQIRSVTARIFDKASQAEKEQTFVGDHYFSSMPVKDLIESLAAPDLPKKVRKVAASLPYRDFITVGLLVRKLKLKNTTKHATVGGIVPDCWIYIQEKDVKIGRLQIFNNWSPYMPADNEHTVWIGLEYFCTEGDEMWNMSPDDFIRFATDELVKIDLIDQKDVLDATHLRVQKAYPAYFGAYRHFDIVKDYLNQYKNLFCIGRNGQHRYNNMDHSMLTAMEAVRLIRKGSDDKRSLWEVNSEKEYHEEK